MSNVVKTIVVAALLLNPVVGQRNVLARVLNAHPVQHRLFCTGSDFPVRSAVGVVAVGPERPVGGGGDVAVEPDTQGPDINDALVHPVDGEASRAAGEALISQASVKAILHNAMERYVAFREALISQVSAEIMGSNGGSAVGATLGTCAGRLIAAVLRVRTGPVVVVSELAVGLAGAVVGRAVVVGVAEGSDTHNEQGVRQICCRIGSGCLRTALPIVLVTPAENGAAQR